MQKRPLREVSVVFSLRCSTAVGDMVRVADVSYFNLSFRRVVAAVFGRGEDDKIRGCL